ncbi:MAG TPA: sigma-70 family RNA polymerase sigma factor [Planctomycetota bacterium]
MDDLDLLRSYGERGSEEAFRGLVERYGRLVYSVCFRQLRRADLAEDATQITFALLAAKAARLSRSVSLSAWLQRSAWNVARRLGRAEGRRERHEKEAEMRQAAGTRPEVDEALAALPEKYRDPICLRYLERRSPEEVARRLGCGVDAARMRVNRGLEKMRDFLERRGAPFAMAALIAFFEERLLEAAPSGLTLRVASEVLSGRAAAAHRSLLVGLSGTTVRVAAIGAALAVVAALTLIPVLLTARSGERATAGGTTSSAVRATADAGTRVEARFPDGAKPESVAVVGRILCLPDGRPAPGLRVSISSEDADLPPMIVRSRADGSFRQELPAGRYRVTFNSLAATTPNQLLEAPPFFEGETPPPPAPAAFYYPEYELEETYPSAVEVEALPGRPAFVEFRVRTSRLISGWIRTDDGRIPDHVTVVLGLRHPEVSGDEVSRQLAPDPNGYYELPHAYEGAFHVKQLKVEAAGYVPGASRSFDVPERGDVTQIDVRLSRGAAVIGGVEDAEGRPVVDATVSVHPLFSVVDRLDAPNYTSNKAGVDEHGRFRVDGCVAGRYVLVVEHRRRRFAPRQLEIEVRPGSALTEAGRVVLESGVSFRGRVVDREGRPIPQADLSVMDAKEVWVMPTARSDGEGRFQFSHVRAPEGRVTLLSVTAPGYIRKSLKEVACEPELVVTLERACGLDLSLLWEGTGATPRKVDVSLVGLVNGDGMLHQARISPGIPMALSFDSLSPGDYELRIFDLTGKQLSESQLTLSGPRTKIDVLWRTP